MGSLFQDLRYGIRMLSKSPGFAAVAILTLALGIGANTAIFSVVDPLIIHPLPFKNLDRLVKVWETIPSRGVDHNEMSLANFVDWRQQSDVFEHLGAYSWWNVNVSGIEVPERVQGFLVTPDVFTALGVNPILGRTFLPEEEKPGKNHVVMLSYGYWQLRFAGDPGIIGKTLTLNGISRTVVGVMPPNFNFPPGGEMWAPYPVDPNVPGARQAHFLLVVGRLKPGITRERAQAEMNTIAGRLEQQYPKTNTGWRVVLIPLASDVVRQYRPALLLLLAAVGFLLLIACANVANLMLARAASRRRELAIRATLGAGRLRVVRQLITESLMLGVLGGALGVVFAVWGVGLLPKLFPPEFTRFIPGADRMAVDLRALGFTFLLSLLTGTVFGLAPALRVSKLDLNETLKEGATQSGTGAGHHRLRNALVIAEISLALVLLIGTGLMAKSFVHLVEMNPGFRTDHVLTMELALPAAKYKEDQKAAAFYQQLLERIRALPGVQSAGATSNLPLSGTNQTDGILIEGRPAPPPGQINEVNYRVITPDYFQTIGVPVLAGRSVAEQDAATAPPVIILNQAATQRYWPGDDPVGKRIRFGDGPTQPWITVIGVVANMRNDLSETPKAEIYVPFTQADSHFMVLTVRTAGDPLSIASAVRGEIAGLDRDQPVAHIQSYDEVRWQSLFTTRIPAVLLGVFAIAALLLAGVGVYGVMAYVVSQQTHEIGIRVALGAQRGDVMKLVIGQGLRLSGIGLAIGLAGSLALTRVMASLLFGVSATDPATFVSITLLLAGVALLACYVPARRAMRVDPMVALRYE
jgi:putative ABC transport system permease protein